MRVRRFVNSVFNSNSYVIDEGKIAVVIDIGDFDPIKNYIEEKGLELAALLITHTHYDHIYGIREFRMSYPTIPIFTSRFGKEALRNPKWNFSRYHNDEIIVNSNRISVLNDSENLRISPKLDINILSTPGHDKSCLCFKIGNLLFTGDSYIPNVKVVATFPNSSKNEAYYWYGKLQQMSETLSTFPGHGDMNNAKHQLSE